MPWAGVFAAGDWLGLARSLVRPVAVAFANGALAFVCLAFTRFGASVESIWLSNALLTAALMASPLRNWPEVIVGAIAGHIAAHLAVGVDIWFSVAALAGDMAEALVCAALLRRRPATKK